MSETNDARNRMADVQIARRGVRDPHVLDAMRRVPREAFVAPGYGAMPRRNGSPRPASTDEEDIGVARFVPLIGAKGWTEDGRRAASSHVPGQNRGRTLPKMVADAAEPLPDIEDRAFAPFFDRCADRRVVLQREASHGTSEFYPARAAITRPAPLELPPDERLGFRETGLAIGLQALPTIAEATFKPERLEREVAGHFRQLQRNTYIGSRIVTFWSKPQNQRAATWTEHRDINEVMLATALLDSTTSTADLGPASGASPANDEPNKS